MVILSTDAILLILTQLFYFRLFGGLIFRPSAVQERILWKKISLKLFVSVNRK
jgi:hypothetical protein